MKLSAGKKRKFSVVALLLVACCGLSTGAVGDCDPEVNTVIAEGFNAAALSAAEGLINGLFETITPDPSEPNVVSGGTQPTSPTSPTV